VRPSIAERLIELNSKFYAELAQPFAQTRSRPQPGFEQLLAYLPQHPRQVLDVGCGEGRFGRFLLERFPELEYTGVDFSANLLERAAAAIPGRFVERDLTRDSALAGLPQADIVACLAVLQHIPGRDRRVRLLREMGQHLAPEGRMFLSTWQFIDSPRQQRKIVDWSEISLGPDDVDEEDYLLTWKSGGFALRYVAYLDKGAIEGLAEEAGLRVADSFRSDGREGDLNLYSILRHPEANGSS
jgi:SAM-dependent methyltransferase